MTAILTSHTRALSGINCPARLETERGIDFPGAIITVAGLVFSNELAEQQGVQRP
ncbi:MAG: hypothetical protein ACRECP_00025 [Methylocella sp.]